MNLKETRWGKALPPLAGGLASVGAGVGGYKLLNAIFDSSKKDVQTGGWF